MQSKLLAFIGCALFAGLLLVSTAFGYDIIRDDDGGAITWNAGTVTLQLKLGSDTTLLDGSNYNSSVQAAISAWNAQIATVQLNGVIATTGAPADNSTNEIGFDSKVHGEDDFDANVLAVTTTSYWLPARSDGTYSRSESDIIFNSAYTWNSYRGTQQAPAEIRRVALHELGHLLGLDHPDEATPPQSVWAIMNSSIGNLDSLASDDIAGARSLYGIPGGGVAPSFSTHPTNQSVNVGNLAQFWVSASGTTPITYQWQRLPVGGVWTDLPNSGNYSGTRGTNLYVFSPTEDMSGDQFRCRATNGAGNATSNVATLTVTVVAPTIYSQPYGQTTYAGNTATFSVGVSGTSPFTYQWRKNGSPITNATSSSLSLADVQVGDAGNYSVVVANSAGSVTSADATLVVNPAVAPTIQGLPSTLTVEYQGQISFYPTVNGTPNLSYQWKKGGVAISGATSYYYYKYNCTPADSGSYTLTVTNPAGTVTSSPVAVTVNPSVAPAITQQPVGVTAATGYSASFSVAVSGSSPIRYQWYKDGVAILNAVYSYYSINSVSASNAGLYSVVVTNDSGSVTSSAAELVVLPAVLPQISMSASTLTISPTNSSLNFYPSISGTAPFSYQWYRDGVAIPGATSSSFYKYNATASDAGVYHLRVTNEAGLAVSSDITVIWSPGASAMTWLGSGRVGNVVYFLATSPGRIMRYDLAQEAWLPVVYLSETKVPTTFLPTAEGVFIAYNKELVRRSLDLQSETLVTTNSTTIDMLFSAGALIYVRDGWSTHSWNRSTLTAGPDSVTPSGLSTPPVFSSVTQTFYSTRAGVSPNDIEKVTVSGGGVLADGGNSPYHGDFRIGTRQYLSPDSAQLFDNSGVIYTTATLNYAASLGAVFSDLCFLANGTPVALRGQSLVAHGGSGFAETGRYALPVVGYAMFLQNDALFVFSAAASNVVNPGVTKVNASSLTPTPTGSVGSPANKVFSIEDAFIDANSVVHLMSRSEKGIVRWNANTGAFLPTLPLRGQPMFSSYAPAIDRLAMVYNDGALTDLFPGSAPSEDVFGYIPADNYAMALVAMDDLTILNIHQAGVSADLRIVIGMLGDLKYLSTWNYWGQVQAWESTARRLYARSWSYYDNTIDCSVVPTSGILPGSTAASGSNIVPPLRFRSDGALILSANQRILNADLQQVGTLANTVTDGTWLSDGLYTIRTRPNGTELQQWNPVVYSLAGSLSLPGIPLRVFRVSTTRLAVITLINGYAAFHLVDANRVLVSSSLNSSAAFITTPPASRTVSQGSPATFTVTATGTPAPTYQWKKNGVNIPGATGASYTIASASAADAGTYSVVASNSGGSVTSSGAVLTVVLAASDFNIDGRPDILWQNAVTGQRRLWLMNGTSKSSEVSFGSVGLDWQMAGTGDFNSDGTNDIVWQNTANGERAVWLMNGTGVSAQVALVTVDPSWNIAVVADFNQDKRPDLLWENTLTGERGIWLMNGVNLAGYAGLGIQGIQWNAAGAGDFNGDSKPDILWQNSLTGERKVWLMSDTTKSSEVSFGFVGLQWVIGAVADYNGDGSADVFWQDTTTGEHAIWLMNGTTVAGYAFPPTDSTDWVVGRIPRRPAASDFNRDGKPDIVWQNTATGDRSVWLMNGAAFGSEVPLNNVPASWQIAATGDLDNDGRCDVVWQNTVTGERGVWLMNGTYLAGFFSLGTVSLDWQIMGTGDFNADNRTDVLWQNTSTGECGVWLMNGTELSGYASLGAVALDWQIAGVGDFNRDDKPDIIWQNSVTGDRKVWLMNGTAFGSEVSLGNVALSWQIAGVADYNLDGQVDILWQNTSTGESGIWIMNGTALSGYVSLGIRSTNWRVAN